MKKIIGISFLLGLIFLGGCVTTNKISQDELFQKKQECANLNDDIKNEAEGYYFLYRITEIFYSPMLNSCLYIVEISYEDSVLKDYDIRNYFEKTLIITSNDKKEIDNKMKELKGE